MRHSERGSVFSDCLVTGSVMTSQVRHSERGSVISDCLVTGSVMDITGASQRARVCHL